MYAKRILLMAFAAWFLDAASKWWAHHYLSSDRVTVAIPHFMGMVLLRNPGGSYGLGRDWMELCLVMPALMVFIIYLWLVRKEKAGFKPSLLLQIGLALLTGGTLGNWSERVINGGVTDFCWIKYFRHTFWNVADLWISGGFGLLAIETFRLSRRQRLENRAATGTSPSGTGPTGGETPATDG